VDDGGNHHGSTLDEVEESLPPASARRFFKVVGLR